MAIASAGLLGYRLPLNFNFPYLATSITQGWNRWHMTLTHWFRDYLFVALGGADRHLPRYRIYASILLVYLLCGLWHGASWHFVLFGLFHGLFLVMEQVTGLKKKLRRTKVVGILYILIVWILSTPLFRAGDISSAFTMMSGLLGFGPSGEELLSAEGFGWALFLGFAVVHVAMYRGFLHTFFRSLPDWIFAPLYGLCIALALAFTKAGYTPFIYFQF
jgi:alginate O-acetyltransferase complex protein AlgI